MVNAQNLRISTEKREKIKVVATNIPGTSNALLALPPYPLAQRWVSGNNSANLNVNRGIFVLRANINASSFDPFIENTSAIIHAKEAKHFAIKFRYTKALQSGTDLRLSYKTNGGGFAGQTTLPTSGKTGWQIVRGDLSSINSWAEERNIRIDFFEGANASSIPVNTAVEVAWIMVTQLPDQSLDEEYIARISDYFWKFDYNKVYHSGELSGPITVDRFQDGQDLAHRRWVAVNNSFSELTSGYVTQFNSESTRKEPLPLSRSIKGLSSVDKGKPEDKDDLELEHEQYNLVLNSFIDRENDSNLIAKTDNVGIFIAPGVVANGDKSAVEKTNVVQTAKLLTGYMFDEWNKDIPKNNRKTDSRNPLRHLDAKPRDAINNIFFTVAPNLDDYRGYCYYRAIVNFVASRWGVPNENSNRAYIRRFAAGNEVTVHRAWHHMGNKEPQYVYDQYYRQLRISDLIVRSIHRDSRIQTESNANWDALTWPNGIAGGTGEQTSLRFPDFIYNIDSRSKAEGDFPWGVAKHPYPEYLPRADWWNDHNDTTEDESTKNTLSRDTEKVSFKNLEVLLELMTRKRLLYNGRPREIEIPEVGFLSNNFAGKAPDNSESLQAAAFAYAYRKMDLSDQVSTWDYHGMLDEPGSLQLGLRDNLYVASAPTYDENGKAILNIPGDKKLIYDTFAAADRDDWKEVWNSQNLLQFLPIDNWDDAAPLTTRFFFTFNDERSRAMWTRDVNNINNFSVSRGALRGESTTADPNIRLGCFANTETAEHLYVRMKTNVAGNAAFYWTSEKSPNEDQLKSWTFPVQASSDFKTYKITLKGRPYWFGQLIRSLRFDPIDKSGSRFEIDAVWSGYSGDQDGDGIRDVQESAFDVDGDGIAAIDDFDNDGDGYFDTNEIQAGLSPTEWDLNFDQTNNFLNLQVLNVSEKEVVDGKLKAVAATTDPQVLASDLAIDLNKFSGLLVRMKSDQPATTAKLYWATDSNPPTEEQRIDIQFTPSNDYQSFIIPLDSIQTDELIRWLRFDPGSVIGASFEIDYIALSDGDYDNDGLADINEGPGDFDNDGFSNYEDPDSDGDGNNDGWEVDNNLNHLSALDFGFEFNGPKATSFQGWSDRGTIKAKLIDVKQGNLLVRSAGNDPYILHENLSIKGSDITTFELSYWAQTNGEIQLYWTTEGETEYKSERRVSFPRYTTPKQFMTQVLDLSSHPLWKNDRITSIRLDLINGEDVFTRIDSFKSAPNADTDGDGLTNREEILAGFDPNSATDFGFDFNGNSLNGWATGGTVGAKVLDRNSGTFLVRSSGADPYIVKDGISFEGSLVPMLELRYKADRAGAVKVFWTTQNNSGYSQARSIDFPAYTTPNQYVKQVVDLRGISSWMNQTITSLRIDLVNGNGVHTRIDSIVNGGPLDTDGDGMSNEQEFDEGFDPNDAVDFGFDFNGPRQASYEGWYDAGTVGFKIIDVNNGNFLIRSSGNDPYIINENFSFNGSVVPILELRYKAQAAGKVLMFWQTENDQGFSPDRVVSFPAYTTSGEYEQHVLDMTSHANWMGQTITALRIDVINGNGVETRIDSFVNGAEIDSDGDGLSNEVEIAQDYDPNSAADFGFDFNGQTAGAFEGWTHAGTVGAKVIDTKNGTLLVRSSGSDPYLVRDGLLFEGSEVPKLEVTFAAQRQGTVQLYWTTESGKTYSGTRQASFPKYTTPNQFVTQTLDLSSYSTWMNEKITSLRLDVINGDGVHTRIDSFVAK